MNIEHPSQYDGESSEAIMQPCKVLCQHNFGLFLPKASVCCQRAVPDENSQKMDFVDYFFIEKFLAPDKSLEAGTGAPLHVRAVRPHCARQVGLQRWPHPSTCLAA